MKPVKQIQNSVSQFAYTHRSLEDRMRKMKTSVDELTGILGRMEKKEDKKGN